MGAVVNTQSVLKVSTSQCEFPVLSFYPGWLCPKSATLSAQAPFSFYFFLDCVLDFMCNL